MDFLTTNGNVNVDWAQALLDKYGDFLNTLKHHQVDAVKFLISRSNSNKGSIICHSPGAGKTLTVLTFLELMYFGTANKIYLVLMPTPVYRHWISECRKWLKVDKIHGKMDTYFAEDTSNPDSFKFRNGLTLMSLDTYSAAVRRNMTQTKVDVLIVDEGHLLRNGSTNINQIVSNVLSTIRVLITGTPVSNSLNDMHQLVKLVDPSFMNVEKFQSQFGRISQELSQDTGFDTEKEILCRTQEIALQELISEYVHFGEREPESNSKIDLVLYIQLTKEEECIYSEFMKSLHDPINLQNEKFQNVISIMTSSDLTLCDPKRHGLEFLPPNSYELTKESMKRSKYHGKIRVVMEIARKSQERNKKLIIFSSYLEIVNKISTGLMKAGFQVDTLNGSMTTQSRSRSIEGFNKNNTNILIISKKSGALGINLHGADIVVILDVDWNPQIDFQASLRPHRFEHVGPLVILRIVMANTLDEHKLCAQIAKLKMATRITSSGGSIVSDSSKNVVDKFVDMHDYILRYNMGIRASIIDFAKIPTNQPDSFLEISSGVDGLHLNLEDLLEYGFAEEANIKNGRRLLEISVHQLLEDVFYFVDGNRFFLPRSTELMANRFSNFAVEIVLPTGHVMTLEQNDDTVGNISLSQNHFNSGKFSQCRDSRRNH